MVLPLAVDLRDEERFDDVNARLSSCRISPLNSDDAVNVDSRDCTTLTECDAEPGHGSVNQHLPAAGDYHPECDETNGQVTVKVDDIFVSASSSLLSSCENPVSNVA